MLDCFSHHVRVLCIYFIIDFTQYLSDDLIMRFQTSNVVYLVTCRRCKKQYVGKTEQALKQRHYGHRREIELQSTPLGKHFAGECGYANWSMQVW